MRAGSVLDDPDIAARLGPARRPVAMATGHDAEALTLLQGNVERLHAAEELQTVQTKLLGAYTEQLVRQANTNFHAIEARLAQFQTITNTQFATLNALLKNVAQRLEAIEQQRPPPRPGS